MRISRSSVSAGSTQQRDPLNILLVEDDDDHATLITRGLSRAEVATHTERVIDGTKALAFLRAEPPYANRVLPNMVLLDINLPRLSGHDVLSAVRADPELSDTPIIIVSTSSDADDVRKAYHHRANGYVVKPSNFDELCALINDLTVFWGCWNVPPPPQPQQPPTG